MRYLILIASIFVANSYSESLPNLTYEINSGELNFVDNGKELEVLLVKGDTLVSACKKIEDKFNDGGEACDIPYLENNIFKVCSSQVLGLGVSWAKIEIKKGRPWYFLSDLENTSQDDVSPKMVEKMKKQIRKLRSQNRDYSYRYDLEVTCT